MTTPEALDLSSSHPLTIEKLEDTVASAARGDSKAFDQLVRQYYGMVYSVVYARLQNPDIAQDAVQEVFLRAYTNLENLKQQCYFSAWLSRIARNLAIEWARTRKRHSEILPMISLNDVGLDFPDRTQPDIRVAAERREEIGHLNRALKSLDGNEREMVLLYFGEDWSQEEIADRLRIHRSTVSRTLTTALRKMRYVLHPILRETCRAALPSPAVGSIAAVIVAFNALPAISKASVVVQISGGVGTSAASGVSSASAILGTSASAAQLLTTAALSAGGKIMAGKAVAGGAAVIIIIASGWYIKKTLDPPLLQRRVQQAETFKSFPAQPPNIAASNGLPAYYAHFSPPTTKETSMMYGNGKVLGKGVDLLNAVTNAWSMPSSQIVYENVDPVAERRDIVIQAPKVQQNLFERIMQLEIEKGYGVSIRKENRQTDVYILSAPHGTAKLKAASKSGGGSSRVVPKVVTVAGMPLKDIANQISSQTDRLVLFEGADSGRYDAQLDLSDGAVPVVQAVREQLGLELTPARRAVELLIVKKR